MPGVEDIEFDPHRAADVHACRVSAQRPGDLASLKDMYLRGPTI